MTTVRPFEYVAVVTKYTDRLIDNIMTLQQAVKSFADKIGYDVTVVAVDTGSLMHGPTATVAELATDIPASVLDLQTFGHVLFRCSDGVAAMRLCPDVLKPLDYCSGDLEYPYSIKYESNMLVLEYDTESG